MCMGTGHKTGVSSATCYEDKTACSFISWYRQAMDLLVNLTTDFRPTVGHEIPRGWVLPRNTARFIEGSFKVPGNKPF